MSAELRRIFSVNLAERRRRVGFAQAELAEKSGVSTEFVSRLERAVTLPSLPTLVALCRALRCSPNDLLLGERTAPTSFDAVAARVADASPDTARQILRVAEALLEYGATNKGKPKKRR